MKSRKWKHGCAVAVLAIPALQVLLFLVSWLINAALPEAVVRSLLGSEGIRWFFGSFVDNVASVPVAWLLVVAIAYGAVRVSGIVGTLRRQHEKRTYREKFALRIVVVMTLFFLLVLAAISFLPHAPLLSATGALFPSSFSRSIIPALAFCAAFGAVTFGILAGGKQEPVEIVAMLSRGIKEAAPLILVYVMLAELVCSIAYVFRLTMP